MGAVDRFAPSDEMAVDYDRRHLALYAELIDAADAGTDWQTAAVTLMRLNVSEAGAEACWRSHLDRARWIIGDGLASAIVAFNGRPGGVTET